MVSYFFPELRLGGKDSAFYKPSGAPPGPICLKLRFLPLHFDRRVIPRQAAGAMDAIDLVPIAFQGRNRVNCFFGLRSLVVGLRKSPYHIAKKTDMPSPAKERSYHAVSLIRRNSKYFDTYINGTSVGTRGLHYK